MSLNRLPCGWLDCVHSQRRVIHAVLDGIDAIREAGTPVFVIATAQETVNVYSDVLTAGRIDQLVQLSVPQLTQRREVLAATCKATAVEPGICTDVAVVYVRL